MLTSQGALAQRLDGSGQAAADARAEDLLVFDQVSCSFALRRGLLAERALLTAVDAVSFRLGKGETLGLVGESGCGKSTLGRLAGGLLAPSAGQVLLDGKPLPLAGAGSRAAGRIQMVFQDPFSSLNPRMSVGASVAEPLIARDVARAERRELTEEVLAAVGLAGQGGRYPHEFSGGQRQRIAVARALITRPDVVICDEPVSALDASVQAQILNLLCDVQENFGPSYLFISHDLAVVGFICQRIMVMYLGKIVEEAPREALFERAAHPYTRALMAAAPAPVFAAEMACPHGSSAVPGFSSGQNLGQTSTPNLGQDADYPVGLNSSLLHMLEGELPSPLAPPSGCAFHPRCPLVEDICRREAPPWKSLGAGHGVRCWLV